jgi:hypothetical protein
MISTVTAKSLKVNSNLVIMEVLLGEACIGYGQYVPLFTTLHYENSSSGYLDEYTYVWDVTLKLDGQKVLLKPCLDEAEVISSVKAIVGDEILTVC